MKRILLAGFCLLLLTACRKDDDGPKITPPPPTDYTVLPPITQEGKNTFGCLVDGEVWVPRVTYMGLDKYAILDEREFTGSGQIYANWIDPNNNDGLQITFASTWFLPKNFKTLEIPSQTTKNWFNPDFRKGNLYYQHITGDSSNWLNVSKIDTINNFISGEFECTLYHSTGQKIKITQGRFDMPYIPQ